MSSSPVFKFGFRREISLSVRATDLFINEPSVAIGWEAAEGMSLEDAAAFHSQLGKAIARAKTEARKIKARVRVRRCEADMSAALPGEAPGQVLIAGEITSATAASLAKRVRIHVAPKFVTAWIPHVEGATHTRIKLLRFDAAGVEQFTHVRGGVFVGDKRAKVQVTITRRSAT